MKPTRSGPLVVLLGCLALAAFAPWNASAQGTGDPFWISASVGAGSARFTCDPCATDRDGGAAVRVAAGAYARPGLRVGVSGEYWTHARDELRETVKHAGLVGALELRPGSRVQLLAGLGWIGWRSEPFAYDAVDVSVGAGWELPLVGRWALTNTALLHSASFGRLRNNDDREAAVRDVSLSLAGFEVGLIRR